MSAENVRFVVSGEAAVRLRNAYSEMSILEKGERASLDEELAAYKRGNDLRDEVAAICRVFGYFAGGR